MLTLFNCMYVLCYGLLWQESHYLMYVDTPFTKIMLVSASYASIVTAIAWVLG